MHMYLWLFVLHETTQGETTHGRNDSGAKQLTGETTRDRFTREHISVILQVAATANQNDYWILRRCWRC